MNNNQQIVGKRVHHEILSTKYVYFSEKNLYPTHISDNVQQLSSNPFPFFVK